MLGRVFVKQQRRERAEELLRERVQCTNESIVKFVKYVPQSGNRAHPEAPEAMKLRILMRRFKDNSWAGSKKTYLRISRAVHLRPPNNS